MPYILVRHKVRDYDTWIAGFDAHSSARLRGGSRGGQVFRNSDDPNEVFVLLDWDTKENAIQFSASEDLRTVMAEVGVVEPPDIYFLDESAKPDS